MKAYFNAGGAAEVFSVDRATVTRWIQKVSTGSNTFNQRESSTQELEARLGERFRFSLPTEQPHPQGEQSQDRGFDGR